VRDAQHKYDLYNKKIWMPAKNNRGAWECPQGQKKNERMNSKQKGKQREPSVLTLRR
jgi:hypothetical protein